MIVVTAGPSFAPSLSPSAVPTSSVPTALPTITGSVVFVELSKEVTQSLTQEEVEAIIQTAEESFGLFPDNVEASVTYSITGTVDIDIDGEIEEEEGFHDDGASMVIEENIDGNICTPPLFDFFFPVTYRWIILYFDP